MKKISSLVLLFSFSLAAFAQQWNWAKSVDTYLSEWFTMLPIAVDNTGNIFLTQNSWNNAGSADSTCLLKFDANGNEMWRTYIGKNFVVRDAVCIGYDLYLTGRFKDTVAIGNNVVIGRGSGDAFLARFNTNGALRWIRQMGGNGYDIANAICFDSEKHLWITGGYSDTASFMSDTLICQGDLNMFMAEFDSAGSLLYLKTARSINNQGYSCGWKIRCGSNDNIYVLGEWNEMLLDTFYLPNCSCSPYVDPQFLAMMDRNGVVQWLNGTLRESFTYATTGLAIDNAGNSYTVGSWDWTSDAHFMVNKFGSGGQKLWERSIDRGYGCFFEAGDIDIDNDHVWVTSLADMTYYNNQTYVGSDYLLVSELDSSGNILLLDTIPSDQNVQPRCLRKAQNPGEFLISGFLYGGLRLGNDSINTAGGKTFLASFSENISASIHTTISGSTMRFFPNPFHDLCTLCGLTGASEINIYNSLGEKILEQKIISDQTSIDLSDRSKGIYFVQVLNEKGSSVQKIIIE